MLLRRLLALVAAVLLVAGAVALRARLDAGRGGGLGLDAPRVVCATEVAAACARLDLPDAAVVVEDVAATVERFDRADPGVDVWVAPAPWADVAADRRAAAGRADIAAVAGPVVARSPLVLAARTERLAALGPACGGEVTWRCVAEQAGTPWRDVGGEAGWGRVKVALDRPADTAVGLATLVAATTGWADGAPLDAALLGDPATFAWLSDLAAGVAPPSGQAPLERMLLTGGAEYELTGVLAAPARAQLRRAPGAADRITLRRIEPTVTADVVVTGYGDVDRDAVGRFGAQLRPALIATGWRPTGGAAAATEPTGLALPDGDGMPSPGALEELRRTWMEVSG